MASVCSRNRKDHEGGVWCEVAGGAGLSRHQQVGFGPHIAGRGSSHWWEGLHRRRVQTGRRWLWLFSIRKLPEGPAGSVWDCTKMFLTAECGKNKEGNSSI